MSDTGQLQLGAFAEFERSMIRECTRAGLAAARAEGRIGERPRKLDPAQRAAPVDDVLTGRHTIAETARLWKVSAAMISLLVATPAASRQASEMETRAA